MLLFYFILTSLSFLCLLCFRWFLYYGFRRRFKHFYELAATRGRMLAKPPILLAWRPVISSFNNTIEWLLFNADAAVTKPHMLSSLVNLILKSMINSEFEPCCFVNFLHFGYKVGPMPITPDITSLFIFGHEEKGVYELM